MANRQSAELTSVFLRILDAFRDRDIATLSNLVVDGTDFRGIGTDADEWFASAEAFKRITEHQLEEMPRYTFDVVHVDAFTDGPVGWVASSLTLHTPLGEFNLRITAVFVMDHGVWRVVQWHASAPISNQELLGVELTTTLDNLLESVSEDSSAIERIAGSHGTMTLVFTDIVDSTAYGQQIGDQRWAELIARHENLIRGLTEPHGGSLVKMLGDGAMLGFGSARSAIAASLEVQDALAAEPYAVRIGIHAGDVIHSQGDFLGSTVNKAARVAAAADGGETKVSSTVRDLVGALDGVHFGEPVSVSFKGLPGTHQVMTVTRKHGS